MRYAHPTQEHQARAMNKMEQFVAQQKIMHAERNLSNGSQAIQ
jgi:hypothetical protein